ncbi:TonB-dependent receptor [Caulobacter hibisci]|uniref:TonB-dependent receptor n=1 Tax=Caulobacter hibisci TaxID=2035993 RepID=UPI002FCDD41B
MAADLVLNIPAKSRKEALIDLGVQAGISLGGVSNCTGRAPALKGGMSLRKALETLTTGGGCDFQIVDRFTVRIVDAPPVVVRAALSEPEVEAPVEVDRVVVSATKRAAPLNAAPGGVSVVPGERLRELDAVDTTGVSLRTAGFLTTNLGAARNKIMLRGLSDGAFTGRTQQTVGTYLDDIPLTYNAPDPDLRLIDVEQVEVLRGPQGTLYGGGSLSGIYRIVTRRPVLGEWSLETRAVAAATESGSPSRKVEAVLNAPLAGDRAALRLAAFDDVDGGYVDDVNLRLSNVDRTTRRGGRVAVTARLNEAWSLDLSAALQDLASTDTQYTTPSLGGQRRANQVRETHGNRFREAALNINGAGNWGQFASSSGFVRHRFTSRYDATAAVERVSETAVDLGMFDEGSDVRLWVEDMTWTSPSDRRLTWLLGIYGLVGEERGRGELRGSTSRQTLRLYYDETRVDRRREGALYGETTWAMGNGWSASAGARAFSNRVRTVSSVIAPSPGRSRDFDKTADFSDVSTKLSIQKTLDGGGMVYALTSEGYRSGGFNSGGLTAPSASLDHFSPDHLRNYEIGASLRPLAGALVLRAALFHDVWRDIQTDQYLSSGLSYTANVGDARNTGLELEGLARLGARWQLQANALLNRPRMVRIAPSFASVKDAALPGVPDLSAGATLRYERPWRTRKLVLTADVGYVGRSRMTFDPRYSPEMGGYVTGRLGGQLRGDDWLLGLAVTNPANTSGDTFAYGNPFYFGQVRQVTPLRPRTWSVELSRAF